MMVSGAMMMMPFQLEKIPVDLQDTPVENLFLDLYMPMAPGDYVKVYLLGYRYSLQATEGKRFTSHTIANNLNLPAEEVARAWQYWEEKNLVRLVPSGDTTEEPVVEFLSLKTLHLKHAGLTFPVAETNKPAPASYAATPADLLEVHEKEGFRQFFEKIDRLLQRALVPNEEMQILEWLHHYKVDKQVVIMAFQYAVLQKDVRSLPYVAGIIRNWVDEGLSSPELVQAFLDKMQLRYRQHNTVFKSLGFHGRLPSEAESRIMDAWFDQYHFSMEMILKACDFSAGTAKPSIKYINGILERWHQDGLQTPEAVDRQEKLRREKTGSVENREVSSVRQAKKTGFHLPESRGKDYTNEELEKILLGRKRRPRKGDES
jgi:DnaD/phage-associated family protein